MRLSGVAVLLSVTALLGAVLSAASVGLLVSPTDGSAPAASPVISGATEVVIGEPVELEPGTALLFLVGNESLVRLFRREDGAFVAPEVLFDAGRFTRSVNGQELPSFLMGVAMAADGREIVLGVCVRGDCRAPGGVGLGTSVDGYRSTDGGLTWSKYFEVPNSDPVVVAIVPSGVLVAGDAYEATILPAGGKPMIPLEGPYKVYGLNDGTTLFANSASILRGDGSVYATLSDSSFPPTYVHGASEEDVVVTWDGGFGRAGIQFARFTAQPQGPAEIVWHYTSQVACCRLGPRFSDGRYLLMHAGPAAFDGMTGMLHDIDMPFDLPGFPEPVGTQTAPLPTANPSQPESPVKSGGPP